MKDNFNLIEPIELIEIESIEDNAKQFVWVIIVISGIIGFFSGFVSTREKY